MDASRTRSPRRIPATAPTEIRRDRTGLLDHLVAVNAEGWEGPTATVLLTYLRTYVIRPLAADVGLREAGASHAEATAWEAVWLQLGRRGQRVVSVYLGTGSARELPACSSAGQRVAHRPRSNS